MKKKSSMEELIKDFEEKSKKAVSDNAKIWKDKNDELYDVDIHIWRHPGMGNSLQTIVGNKVAIMTATMSYIQTLVSKEVVTESEIREMIEYVFNSTKLGDE